MERGYLIAALALIGAFTGLSRGIQSIEQWSLLHVRYIGTLARAECHASPAARAKDRVQTHLRSRSAGDAQLLAELNVPPANAASFVTEEIARQNLVAARRAQARAMRETERARSEMLRMRDQMGNDSQFVRVEPLSLHVELSPDIQWQIEKTSKMAARMAERQARMQISKHHQCAVPPTPEYSLPE